jgi:hypothetical protein
MGHRRRLANNVLKLAAGYPILVARRTSPQTRDVSLSQLFHSLAKLCGIQLSRTTAHHAAANRLVECFHRTLKAAIMCHADQHWTEALPLVLLGIRTAFKVYLQASVAKLMYGEPLRISGELLTPIAHPVEPAQFCGGCYRAYIHHPTTTPTIF